MAVEDSDSVTLNASESASGTLTWDPAEEGEWELTVSSADDSETVTATVDSAVEIGWDTQTEWSAYQSKGGNITISNGIVTFEPYEVPSSAVHQWKFDEGSGTTAYDSVGATDATINGASWTADADMTAGYLLDADGTDDYLNTGWDMASYVQGGNLTVAFTVVGESFGASSDRALAGVSGGAGNFIIYANDGDWNIDDAYGLVLDDTNGNKYVTRTDTETMNFGDNQRVVIRKTGDTGSGGVDFFINNTPQSVTVEADNNGYDSANYTNNSSLYLFARNHGGAIHHTDIAMDNVIFFDTDLTDQQIADDYNAQPWS